MASTVKLQALSLEGRGLGEGGLAAATGGDARGASRVPCANLGALTLTPDLSPLEGERLPVDRP